MPHPIRLQYAGAWHHAMNRGAARQDVFRDREDRIQFLELLGRITERYRIEIHAFTLMGNHYHMLIRTPEPVLDSAMQYLSSQYTRFFNRRHGRDGPLFRGRYRSLLIESNQYLLGASRYIHRNPLELGVHNLANYEWSSYGAFLGLRKPRPWLSTAATLDFVNGSTNYQAIVESPLRTEVDLWHDGS